MRTLTLGVLIVSSGTLAALPFRRYQAIPDASAQPSQVSGPTQSALDLSTPPTVPEAAPADPPSGGNLSLAASAGSRMVGIGLPASPLDPLPQAAGQSMIAAGSSDPSSDAARRAVAEGQLDTRIDGPLTYEDLAMPISQPMVMQRRFSATAPARQQQLQREHHAGLLMPAMETLALSQQEELQRVAQSVGAKAGSSNEAGRAKAAAKLASTAPVDPSIEPLPESPTAERQRYWIRQPD